MVIAGFPCVDFSTQNSKRKAMADLGESGEGLMAIVKYAQKARPATMILENVEQADWDLFKAVFENKEDFVSDSLGTTIAKQWLQWPLYEDGESSGYVAVKLLLDSKQFYIPQTRRRGYMFLVRKDLFSDEKAREVLQQTWVKMVHLMKRPTSVSTEAFLLPEGDPHLMKAQVDTSQIRIRGDVNWETCKERHRKYRIIKSLGFGRPMTQWTDRGNAVTPDYFWRHWAKVQVERLWDTWEIAHLRNAKKGYDDLYKL